MVEYDLGTLLLFCSELGVDLKLLTVNDFCGTVSCVDVRNQLRTWLQLENLYGYTKVESHRLDGKRGVEMLLYKNDRGNTLTVLDHINDTNSFLRVYFV